MKNLKLSEFMLNIPAMLSGVTDGGDIVRVETDKHGAFVIMEEAEYNIMRDALKTVITAATFEEPEYAAILKAAKKAGVVKSKP